MSPWGGQLCREIRGLPWKPWWGGRSTEQEKEIKKPRGTQHECAPQEPSLSGSPLRSLGSHGEGGGGQGRAGHPLEAGGPGSTQGGPTGGLWAKQAIGPPTAPAMPPLFIEWRSEQSPC